jgi:hypothetical protein
VTKLTFQFLLPFVPVIVLLAEGERGRRPFARRLGAFALGALLPILPFAARNVALGEPPLQMSTLGRSAIVQWNLPSYQGAAEHMAHEEVHAILERSDDTLVGSYVAVVRAHPTFGSYVALVGRKLAFFWMGVDFWNNISVSYLRYLSPDLEVCIFWWGVLSPWALLGLVIAIAHPERRRTMLPLIATFLALGLTTALVGGVYTRFRMVVEPIACVLFASTVVDVATLLRRSAPRSRVAGVVLLGAALGLHALLRDPQPPRTRNALRGYIAGNWRPGTRAFSYLFGRADRARVPD